jgi:hypothetical protein
VQPDGHVAWHKAETHVLEVAGSAAEVTAEAVAVLQPAQQRVVVSMVASQRARQAAGGRHQMSAVLQGAGRPARREPALLLRRLPAAARCGRWGHSQRFKLLQGPGWACTSGSAPLPPTCLLLQLPRGARLQVGLCVGGRVSGVVLPVMLTQQRRIWTCGAQLVQYLIRAHPGRWSPPPRHRGLRARVRWARRSQLRRGRLMARLNTRELSVWARGCSSQYTVGTNCPTWRQEPAERGRNAHDELHIKRSRWPDAAACMRQDERVAGMCPPKPTHRARGAPRARGQRRRARWASSSQRACLCWPPGPA